MGTHDQSDSGPGTCILCHGDKLTVRQRLNAQDLKKLYTKFLGIDIFSSFNLADNIYLYDCMECGLGFFWPQYIAPPALYQRLDNMLSAYYCHDKFEFSISRRLLNPNDAILEVGCGDGAFGQGFPGYVGLELNPACVQKAGAAGIHILGQTLEDHAAGYPCAYDAVCAFQVLEHVADPGAFLAAALACLRPGGHLILATPNDAEFLRNMTNHLLNLPPHHATRWSGKTFQALEELYPVSLQALYLEPLRTDHAAAWTRTLYETCFRRLLGVPARLVSPVPRGTEKAVAAVSSLLADATSWLPRLARRFLRGESILAVYKKLAV